MEIKYRTLLLRKNILDYLHMLIVLIWWWINLMDRWVWCEGLCFAAWSGVNVIKLKTLIFLKVYNEGLKDQFFKFIPNSERSTNEDLWNSYNHKAIHYTDNCISNVVIKQLFINILWEMEFTLVPWGSKDFIMFIFAESLLISCKHVA